jgi:hypothetical protein
MNRLQPAQIDHLAHLAGLDIAYLGAPARLVKEQDMRRPEKGIGRGKVPSEVCAGAGDFAIYTSA